MIMVASLCGAHAQRGSELGEHVFLPLAHALGVETHEATLFRGLGRALRALHDPLAERARLLRRRLRLDNLAGARELVEDLLAGEGALRLEVADRRLPLLGHREDLARDIADDVVALLTGRTGYDLEDRRRLLDDFDRPAWIGKRDRHPGNGRRAQH